MSIPFLFGAQYYRAPTPEKECWQEDHQRMKEIGFNSVKYWAQWRWSHLSDGSYRFDDLNELIALAERHGLQVTLNTIFDVAPHWLFERFPDAKQVRCDGQVIEPYTVAHRQIGGHPGPCYNHPGARQERQKFLQAVILQFRDHPALAMWDVWNEPELSFPQRSPKVESMACYCSNCQRLFNDWLKNKYRSLEHLNNVWGRCYETWEQVETPRNPRTITDYIDWREFHIETMTAEAAWRLGMVAELDPTHTRYLHVVPNTMEIFNSVSCCTDDFKMAEMCQVFAATMNGGPVYAPQVLSAARGKLCYNVESHLNFGMTNMHQRSLELDDLLRDWLPQVGLGIRGFLFWQFRPEVLGYESPAWGVVNLDGSDREITCALRDFWGKFSSFTTELVEMPPNLPEVGIWKSRQNEVFHFCIHNTLKNLVESVEGYVQQLYWDNIAYRFISGEMLARGELDSLKCLIMPSPYYLSQEEANQLDQWVRNGGVLLTEAHLAGYDASTGRHSRSLPGCGLAESWGIQETTSTSSYHLKVKPDNIPSQPESFTGATTEDTRKALEDLGTHGGLYFPLHLAGGGIVWGADRYATLQANLTARSEAWLVSGNPCILSQPVGSGWVLYAGTYLGQGSWKDSSGLSIILQKVLASACIEPMLSLRSSHPGQVRIDPILDRQGNIRFLVVQNRAEKAVEISTHNELHGTGIFSGINWNSSASKVQILPEKLIDFINITKR